MLQGIIMHSHATSCVIHHRHHHQHHHHHHHPRRHHHHEVDGLLGPTPSQLPKVSLAGGRLSTTKGLALFGLAKRCHTLSDFFTPKLRKGKKTERFCSKIHQIVFCRLFQVLSSNALSPDPTAGTFKEVAVDEEQDGRDQNGGGIIHLKTCRKSWCSDCFLASF